MVLYLFLGARVKIPRTILSSNRRTKIKYTNTRVRFFDIITDIRTSYTGIEKTACACKLLYTNIVIDIDRL